MSVHRKRIPVTVIGGFLGSGKTTLVNHLTGHPERRFGVIVNEFGALGVDGALIEQVEEESVTELRNGCLCCFGRDDLLRALVRLAARERAPEYLLIELSGLADPAPVLQTLLGPEVRAVFDIDGLVTVVDAAHFGRTLRQNPEAALQLAYASVIVVNKADLVDERTLQEVTAAARQLNPLASVITVRHSQVNSGELIGLGSFEASWSPPGVPTVHTPGVGSFALTRDTPISMREWHFFLQDLILSRPADVLRVKGFLSLEGVAETVLFQAVRDVFSAEAMTGTRAGGSSQLVVIGRHLDAAEYREAFARLGTPEVAR